MTMAAAAKKAEEAAVKAEAEKKAAAEMAAVKAAKEAQAKRIAEGKVRGKEFSTIISHVIIVENGQLYLLKSFNNS